MFLVEQSIPEPVNWQPSYSNQDKIPYGASAIYAHLSDIFPQQKINVTRKSIYEVYQEDQSENSDFNYIFIQDIFSPQNTDASELLNFVEDGGFAFIAAHTIEGSLAKELNIKMAWREEETLGNDTITEVYFTPKYFPQTSRYQFINRESASYFSNFNSEKGEVIAENDAGKPVFLRIRYGEGYFYLCTLPMAYTNYNLLWRNNTEFIANSLSLLPLKEVFWDEYFKAGRDEARTPFRFILSRQSLRMAYYLTLITLILYVWFKGKRKQRVIPIIEPLRNTTLDFTEVIGRLYYSHKDHKNLALKKIQHFMDFIRTHYFVRTNQINNEVIEKLSAKTGMKKAEIKEIFYVIEKVNQSPQIPEATLVLLNTKIEKFKTRANVKPATV
jgi:hypothetical protein